MKEKTFYIDTPPIHINQLSEKDDFQIDFDLRSDGFVGVLIIRLDPDHIEWDNPDEEEYFPTECNRLIVSVTTELDMTSAPFLENTYFSVIEYLSVFFNYLQTELGQYWVDIGPIRDWDLITFLGKTIESHVVYDGEGKFGIPIGGYGMKKKVLFSPRRRIYPEKSSGLDIKQIPVIKSWFQQHREPELATILLANSKRLLLHSDYRLSSVLAITALEGPLKRFVKKRCQIKGIPRGRDGIANDLGRLPAILEPDELTNWLEEWLELSMHWYVGTIESNQVIGWALELNRARNKAVHEGTTPNFETLDKGIFAVEALYEFTKKV